MKNRIEIIEKFGILEIHDMTKQLRLAWVMVSEQNKKEIAKLYEDMFIEKGYPVLNFV